MIYIEVIRKKWEPGKNKDIKDIKTFERFIAEEYVKLVQKRVADQRYRNHWRPLSRRYLEQKKQLGLSLKTWEATGELISNLKVKSKNVVGFDKRKRHKVSGETYNDIARELEYGSTRVPPRPLFRTAQIYMSKNINMYIKKYNEVKE